MSCNLGKTETSFTVDLQVFFFLFWCLVEHFKLLARTKDAQDTRDAFLESVYPRILVIMLNTVKLIYSGHLPLRDTFSGTD